jgi:predicted NBD/HSP70 family sugar kinase
VTIRRISPTAFRVARRGTQREINRQIALNLVRSRQPISRAELARLMGVRRGGISRLVEDLIRSKLVFEGPKGEAKRGRKPTYLFIETRRRCAVAVDISASRTLIEVTDPLGRALMDARDFPTGPQSTHLICDLSAQILHILAEHPEFGTCLGIGVVVAGLVDSEKGLVRYSPTLRWRDVDIRDALQRATKLPVVVENSVKACVLAQVWAVHGHPHDHPPVDGLVAFVNVSDGVGVGIAINGQLLRGARNNAGEFGHLPLTIDGPRCACGQRGCWEAYVSVRATIARYLGADPSWPESAKLRAPAIQEIVARARAGEARACESISETGYYLGRGLAAIVKAIEPERIYVSGEIVEGWDLVLPSVQRAMQEQALTREAAESELLIVPLGEHPRLRGAAALVTSPAFAAPVVA